MTPLKTGGPITQRRAEDAADWMVHNAHNIAKAKALRDYCDDRLRVVKALAMSYSNEKSVSAREQEAYASALYQKAVNEKRDATLRYEELMNTRIAAQT